VTHDVKLILVTLSCYCTISHLDPVKQFCVQSDCCLDSDFASMLSIDGVMYCVCLFVTWILGNRGLHGLGETKTSWVPIGATVLGTWQLVNIAHYFAYLPALWRITYNSLKLHI